MDRLDQIFSSFTSKSLFENKMVLQSNYSPNMILHRDAQIESVASILAPALRGERASNLFIYGKTGSGKTLSVQHVGAKILEKINSMGSDHLKLIYVNCKLKKVADTEYRILAELIHELGGSVPATGLPTDNVYTRFVDLIDNKKQMILIILDEIDHAVKKISDNLDPRVKSSLGEEEIIFPPYNALQLQDILKERAEKAFKAGVIDEGVIAKCAAFAAREHGDARRALDLLRVAVELAERENGNKISLIHIDAANQKIEKDKMLDIIESEPRQFQLVLLSIMQLDGGVNVEEGIFTGDVYNMYKEVCDKTSNEVLTQRRVKT